MSKFFQNVFRGAEGTTLQKQKNKTAIPTISFEYINEILLDSFPAHHS